MTDWWDGPTWTDVRSRSVQGFAGPVSQAEGNFARGANHGERRRGLNGAARRPRAQPPDQKLARRGLDDHDDDALFAMDAWAHGT
ncbi:hypothetical protein E4U32_002421 [Claviceps aff. humidiphila group G2b]|nr:hypothetical protein E4U32_002421 [Claviceps aff. humidiphila group G2b]